MGRWYIWPRPPQVPRDWRKTLAGPAQTVILAFALLDLAAAGLLMLPLAQKPDQDVQPVEAFFTSTSALTVTGLTVVDTPETWSLFGLLVILLLVQIGGIGIIAFASLLILVSARSIGLKMRLTTQTETTSLSPGDVRRVVFRIARYSLLIEAVVAAILALRFALAYDYTVVKAGWYGVFHAVTSFNHAGFALFSDSLVSFLGDAWITLTIDAAVILGSLGFPVLYELWHSLPETKRAARRRPAGSVRRRLTPNLWSLHTRLVILFTIILLVVGFVLFTALEWGNPRTLGPLPIWEKLVAGVTGSVQPRSGGFNSVDYAEVTDGNLLSTQVLMFIGGGSASTAGGIKVTTFAVLLFAVLATVRGESDVTAVGRRVAPRAQRTSLVVVTIYLAVLGIASILLVTIDDQIPLDAMLFDTISAAGTVGLSTGASTQASGWSQLILSGLMLLGRVGPVTLATALAMRETPSLYRLPEERPLVG